MSVLGRTPAELVSSRNIAAGVFGVFAAAAGVVQAVSGPPWLKVTFAGIAVLGAIVGVSFHLLERRALNREREEEREDRLRIPIRAVGRMTPYELGVDAESPQAIAASGLGDRPPYVRRSCDGALSGALQKAGGRAEPTLVVLEGPSKAGKSRTLFEAAVRTLPNAPLVAPRDADAVALLAREQPPGLSRGEPVLVWLDDLEPFVRLAGGLDDKAMSRFAGWSQPVVLLATYGGKGQRQLEGTKLAEPINALLGRWSSQTRFSLVGRLDEEEKRAARAAEYRPEAVAAMAAGIGEYMIAAERLETKLTTGRHEPGADQCREGVAVVRAAIDWQRVGMRRPIGDDLLRELHANYLPAAARRSDEEFERGLAWALEPLYESIALLHRAASFLPYDHIVAFADRQGWTINRDSLRRILGAADAEDAFTLGLLAYARRDWAEAEIAWQLAAETQDTRIAAPATFNLGFLLQERGKHEAAEAAWVRADRMGDAAAAFNLGMLRLEQTEDESATAAFGRAAERGIPAAAVLLDVLSESPRSERFAETLSIAGERDVDHLLNVVNIGVLLEQRGDTDAAASLWEGAADLDIPEVAGPAALNLGHLRLEGEDAAGAQLALERAALVGNPEVAREARRILDQLRQGS